MERSWLFLSISLIFDLAIVLILALSLYMGWKQGVVRGVLTLVGSIIALTLSAQVADFAADTMIAQVVRPATYAAIERHAEELLPSQESYGGFDMIGQLVDAIENDFVREKVQELLSETISSATVFSRDALCSVVKELADTVLDGVVQELLSTLLCILCFAVLSLVVRIAISVLCKAFQLPVLQQLDRSIGLLLGGAKGLLFIFVAVWALRLLGLWLDETVIADSTLLRLVAQALDRFSLTGIPSLQ